MTLFPFDWVAQDVSWQNQAACKGKFQHDGRDLFFPPDNPGGPKKGKGVPGEKDRIAKAKALCDICPVKRECFDFAVANDCVGIWGGMTDRERKFAESRRKKGIILAELA